jgi:hypothetical protein
VVRRTKIIEPETADLRQHPPLIGNTVGHYPVESADAVGTDHQQLVAQIVDISHLAAPHRISTELRLQDSNGHDHLSQVCIELC